jgi:hypothetical protein
MELFGKELVLAKLRNCPGVLKHIQQKDAND